MIMVDMDSYAEELSRVIEILKENPRGLSVTDIAAQISVNRNTVSRYLDMLRISGQVDMKTYGKAKVFFISQRAPISAMINFSSDMVAVIDRDLAVAQVNDSFCEFLDIKREDIIGKELRNSPLVGFDHPVINERIMAALEGKESTDEIRIMKVDEEKYFKIRLIPTVLNDSTPGVTLTLEDITKRKKAEEALISSERNYRSLVEEINDAIWDLDDNARFTYVSPRTTEILGFQPSELIDKPIYEILNEEGKSALDRCIRECRNNGGGPEIFNCSVMHSNGHKIILESSLCRRYDEFGIGTGYRLVSRDVTEREKAYRGLFKWKSFLNSVVMNIPAMVLVKEVKKGTYIFFNRETEEFFGINSASATGKMGWELFPDKFVEYLISGDREVSSTGAPVSMSELRLKISGKNERIIKSRKVPIFGMDNRLDYILTLLEDITEDKRAEEEIIAQRDQAQSYLDLAGVMIAVVDRQGRLTRINRYGCRMLGVTEDQIIGKNWFETVIPAGRRDHLRKQYSRIIAGEISPPQSEEGVIITSGGGEIPVLWHNSIIKSPEGEITAIVSSASQNIS